MKGKTGSPTAATETVDIDHAVQLVGYGTDKLPYWTVRNSWSDSWGEKGFIRIDRTSSIAGTCYDDPVRFFPLFSAFFPCILNK